jgi:hypothetical protein
MIGGEHMNSSLLRMGWTCCTVVREGRTTAMEQCVPWRTAWLWLASIIPSLGHYILDDTSQNIKLLSECSCIYSFFMLNDLFVAM